MPSVGGDADDGDKERDEEEEKLRREAIKEAELQTNTGCCAVGLAPLADSTDHLQR